MHTWLTHTHKKKKETTLHLIPFFLMCLYLPFYIINKKKKQKKKRKRRKIKKKGSPYFSFCLSASLKKKRAFDLWLLSRYLSLNSLSFSPEHSISHTSSLCS